LEKDIDRNLNLNNPPMSDTRRSESPVDEGVWIEILGERKDKGEKEMEKGSLGDVPPTPESMRT